MTAPGGCPLDSKITYAAVTNNNPYVIIQNCGFTTNFNYNGPGQTVHPHDITGSYHVIQCPIDNLHFLLLPLLCIGYRSIRRVNVYNEQVPDQDHP